MRRIHVLLAVLALTVLTACSGSEEPETAATPDVGDVTPATPATSAPEPSPAPTNTADDAPDDGNTEPETEPAGGGAAADEGLAAVGSFGEDAVTSDGYPSGGGEVALLTDVRAAEHDGFDRVVLEFAGTSVPTYQVSWAQPPITQDGSGNEVEIEGSAHLQIHVAPAAGVDLSGDQAVQSYTGPERVEGDTTMVTEVVRTGDFEANLTWVVGLHQRMPFAVEVLGAPVRLVIDIAVP